MIARAIAWFSSKTHPAQQRVAIAMDVLLCAVATWLAFALRLGFLYVPVRHYFFVLAVALLLWFPIAFVRGVYQSILRYSGGRTMMGLVVAGGIMALMMAGLFQAIQLDGLPRTVGVLQPMTFVGLLGASRLFVRFVLVDLAGSANGQPVKRVLIYGAGRAGQQLALSLRHEEHIRVAGYLDDDPRLHGQRLDGLKVYGPETLSEILDQWPIDEILLAMPNIRRVRRKEIVEQLQKHGVAVRALPSTAKMIDNEVSVSDLRPVSIEDLLGRDPVPADEALLGQDIAGKVVLVTGAGGSIGSELCRQILQSNPRRLVLFDQSEFALYQIDEELRSRPDIGAVEIVTELGSVVNEHSVRRLFERWKPHTVFHAAAYKHVPIVESNPVAGVLNNVFGTLFCCIEAERAKVGTFILISTDKAVRPTNIMGASKRVCELVLQARAGMDSATRFTMVRFGNVLGSSGSVVPKFQAQISAGGPVTLTHRDVTRYFMTIPEAAQLVIQAGAMSEGGDVFVLDMGQPVRIFDLARTMIELSGLTVRDENNPDGDIEVKEIGLRPGEKKFEELLIGANPRKTGHPRIIKAHESYLPWADLELILEELSMFLRRGDSEQVTRLLRQLVPDFGSSEGDGTVIGFPSATTDIPAAPAASTRS